ncbi:MAG: double-strand break repair protein AddB [Boseongicola sp.]|nr:double-strand break repair protein AddB [Boseongicola sp.]MDD9979375.1 double-strand break repair protein AddB [Boseongicola sp.]
MFESQDTPRIFAVSPGADFPRAIVGEVLDRYKDQPPDALARCLILVNTERMRRRMTDLFCAGAPLLLPKIALVSQLSELVPEADIPPPISPLERKLEIARLVRGLLQVNDAMAPESAVFDLSDSLAKLIDEMQSEGVSADDVAGLDVGLASEHWRQSQSFLAIVGQYLEAAKTTGRDPEARQRQAANALTNRWSENPPATPVLLVGSTGSRGTTFSLMQSISRLPQGAVILPGFDRDMPVPVWRDLISQSDHGKLQDHPQARFAKLLKSLELEISDVSDWPSKAPDSARNALISLSMRPAPVTSQWRTDGPGLGDLRDGTQNISLIEAETPRFEAVAIAAAMRDAVGRGKTVALVTPDRTLGRRVTAALGRWNIIPDDSAGRPLNLSPPGRLLRFIARMAGAEVQAEDAIIALKHPLAHTGGNSRNEHARLTNELEIFLRKKSLTWLNRAILDDFLKEQSTASDWTNWLCDWLLSCENQAPTSLGALAKHHRFLTEQLCQGSEQAEGTGELWEKEAGEKTKAIIESLAEVADMPASLREYQQVLDQLLAAENTRETEISRADVMIWGTLEARVQGADLVILGGLNEGVWPSAPDPDPWLSRDMRRRVRLLSPDRLIGLSAHDYQQAAAAPEVILSRSRRDEEAEAVPARWLNRLTNLLDGLPEQNGEAALAAMRDRGKRFTQFAQTVDQPEKRIQPELRPCPAPPVSKRPRQLSVTDVERLIRDPYAIYAKHVLRLKPLSGLRPDPNAAMRGTVFHQVMKEFMDQSPFASTLETEQALLATAHSVIWRMVPIPNVRASWFGHIGAIAARISEEEEYRSTIGAPVESEVRGNLQLPEASFAITGRADRIDRLNDGTLAVYDYKTGQPPTIKQVREYALQLLLEAIIAEGGGFEGVPAERVSKAGYITLSRSAANVEFELREHRKFSSAGEEIDSFDFQTVSIKANLLRLIEHYDQAGRGYVARRSVEKQLFEGDYDHLSRYGEWDDTMRSETLVVS